MRRSILRVFVSFLIIAPLAIAGFWLGTQINLLIADLDLYEKDLWFKIGRSPEDDIISVSAMAGSGYMLGKSGTIYSTCDFIYEDVGCWREVDSYPIPYAGSCIKHDPPGELLQISTQCGIGEIDKITGIALSNNGEVWGYFADLDLWKEDLWINIGRSPEDSIVSIAPDVGFGYLLGKSGTIYSTCDVISEKVDCWREVETYPVDYDDSCIKRDPPGKILIISVQCGFGEIADITGIALRDNGDVWGYYGRAQTIGESIAVWLLLSLLGSGVGLSIGVLVLRKLFQKNDLATDK